MFARVTEQLLGITLLSVSDVLICFTCNTHSQKGDVFSPDTQMVFTHLLNYQQLGQPFLPSVSKGMLHHNCLCVCEIVISGFCCLTIQVRMLIFMNEQLIYSPAVDL